MVLNYEEIIAQKIIQDHSDECFHDGSYDLTINEIIDMNNNISDVFQLKPQGMVYVVFKEKLVVPQNIIGFAHVKTSITKRGIMATNIGIIDPNYVGYISTLLINFGKTDCHLKKGQPALRITFSELREPNVKKELKDNNLSLSKYIERTHDEITKLDVKFLNLNSVEKEVEKSVRHTIRDFVFVFTVAGFVVAAIFQFKNSEEKDVDRAINRYEVELSTVSEKNKNLQEQLNVYNLTLKSLEDSLKNQSLELKKLRNPKK